MDKIFDLLLIDDEIYALEALSQTIPWPSLGIGEVFSCSNITKAKEICRSQQIPIIICDIEMPNGTGLEFAHWLLENYPETLILFLTCHSDFFYAKEAISCHAFAYLLKPFDKEELCQTIQNAVQTLRKRPDRTYLTMPAADSPSSGKPEQIVRKIQAILKDDIAISREELAKKVYLNPDYMTRLFKRVTGRKLSKYINELKLETAKQLLTETNEPISSIAVSLAYVNFSYFSKMFKTATGMSPKEYRKKFSQNLH
ncbi:MAG: response regulator [Lachnospiraceae bacterium]|nr:response regulator [Lachnospiraceae bacterium]